MQYLKEDMNFVHYRWEAETAPDHTVFAGEPSRRPFDPFNGEQVLFLINSYFASVGRFSVKEARMIENKIVHNAPQDLKSERSVFNWLIQTEEQAI